MLVKTGLKLHKKTPAFIRGLYVIWAVVKLFLRLLPVILFFLLLLRTLRYRYL
jgi:hypothetical protein